MRLTMEHRERTLVESVAVAIGRQKQLSPRACQALSYLIETADEQGRFYTVHDFRVKMAVAMNTTEFTVNSCIRELKAKGVIAMRLAGHYEFLDWVPTSHVLADVKSFDVVIHCVA